MPFVGVRLNHYNEDAYDVYDTKKSAVGYRSDSDSYSQWTFPLGVKFDWACMSASSGWGLKPSMEVAYVRADGDVDYRTKIYRGGKLGGGFLTAVTDENNFRVGVNLEAKKMNFTIGLNVRGQWSSNQRDIGASLTGK